MLIIVMSLMGLPWYVSATVISLAHMNSLKMETTVSAPGEQPKFLGIRYMFEFEIQRTNVNFNMPSKYSNV